MARVLKREAAKRDLIAQWVWYAENAGIEVADRFLEEVEKALTLLSAQPECGALVPVAQPELQAIRRFPVSGGFEKTLRFYSLLKDGVDLIRAVHGRRDIEELLSEGL